MSRLEELCGMKTYGTDAAGSGGTIKTVPKDFRVIENIARLPEGNAFGLLLLKKTNITTFNAISSLANGLNISKSRISYAGIKDKRAYAEQYITIKNSKRDVRSVEDNNITIEKVGNTSRPIKSSDILSNSFDITIRNIELDVEETRTRLDNVVDAIKQGVPNFFGTQRFGSLRPVTHVVGKHLLRREYERAVVAYLTLTVQPDTTATPPPLIEPETYREARQRLQRDNDYSQALTYFPQELYYEQRLLKKIVEIVPSTEKGWIEVIRTLPRNLCRLFIHAYQSYLFNEALSALLDEQKDIDNFPAKLVGYKTTLSDSGFDKKTDEMLEADGIAPADFKFDAMQELSSTGTLRAALIQPDIAIQEIGEDKLNKDRTSARLTFQLKPGRYATTVMREICKN